MPLFGRGDLALQRNAVQFLLLFDLHMTPSANSRNKLFTMGHSNLDMADLLGVLIRHEIKIVCDVRSRPGSFRYPQFNREPLEARLIAAKIRYEFLGEFLGGRPLDPKYYHADGLVDYPARRQAPDFRDAISRSLALLQERHVTLLCAEEDPLHCHRFLLICPAMIERGIAPHHLRRNGVVETHRDAEDRLLQLHGFADVTSDSLFSHGREAALVDALRLQAEQYGFRSSPEAIEYF